MRPPFSLGVGSCRLLSQPTGLVYLRGGIRGNVVEIGNKEYGLLGGPICRPLRLNVSIRRVFNPLYLLSAGGWLIRSRRRVAVGWSSAART